MKIIRPYIKLLSLLLLVVFASIQLLQAYHMHNQEQKSLVSVTKEASSQHHLDTADIKCSICDYFANTQNKQLHGSTASAYVCYPAKAITLNIDYSQSLYAAAVHTWTNKGPPQA